jgi:hypothetical protein
MKLGNPETMTWEDIPSRSNGKNYFISIDNPCLQPRERPAVLGQDMDEVLSLRLSAPSGSLV